MRLLDHMIVLLLVLWGNFIIFSIMAAPIYIPTNIHTLTDTCYFLPFWLWPFYQVWGEISLWFWFAFPWWLLMLSIFSCTYRSSVCLLWKNIYLVPLPIFKLDGLLFLLLSCMSSLYILDTNFLSDMRFTNILSRAVGYLFICWWFTFFKKVLKF